MHICYIYPGFPPETHSGGIGTFIEELVHAISKDSSHVIDVISRSDSFCDHTEHISDNLTLHRLGENPLAAHNPSLLFRNNGYSRHYDRVVEKVLMIHNVNRIDIIEAADWGAEAVNLLADPRWPLLIRCHTRAFISESYNPNNDTYLSEGIKSAEKKMLSLAEHIVSPSRSLIEEISKYVG